jgi:hypothetical protein
VIFDEKRRLTICLASDIWVSIHTATGRFPYVAVQLSSIHNHKFLIYSLPKRELLSNLIAFLLACDIAAVIVFKPRLNLSFGSLGVNKLKKIEESL